MRQSLNQSNEIDQAAEFLRPELIIDSIAAVPTRPGFIRKGVAYNNQHLGNQNNVKIHLNAGYEIVYSNVETFKDQRDFAPGSEAQKTRAPAPVLKTTSGGTKYVLMEISEEKFKALKEKESADFDAKYKKSVRGMKRNSDGSILVQGGFINDGHSASE